MSEQEIIKKQLIKNMFFTFMVFAILLLFFDAIIYKQVSVYLYKSIDTELATTASRYTNSSQRGVTQNKINNMTNSKINPRLIYIIRDNERRYYKQRKYRKIL